MHHQYTASQIERLRSLLARAAVFGMALLGLAFVAFGASGASADHYEIPPLPLDTLGAGGGAGFEFKVRGIRECPDPSDGGPPIFIAFGFDLEEDKTYRADIGEATGLEGPVKVRRKAVGLGFLGGEKLHVANLKLSAAGKRQIKNWLTTLVRQCTGDAKAKVKLQRIEFLLLAFEQGWSVSPYLNIKAKAKTRGKKRKVSLLFF